ncbi:ATP-binding protein [Streptomyces olivaceus]|uniref:ATP-binding protein n=1 Tax=Streptomyces olivaceus TaxID=47716 RepID=UPI001CCEE182|nr:LuxR C-terminal-related transcriptional regulator [Streptomyces olivaceus]MBZ6135641.1 LuxR C-terminal-related transcriptional regulator [Streptomyces olivaceus]
MSTPTTVTCDTCGTSLTRSKQSRTSQPRARYCSNACRQRSYRLRHRSGGVDAGLSSELLTQLSSFVGRADELVELTRLLHEVRLLTLTGPAGVGKSRLALEVAGQEARGRRSEVSVVRLGAVTGAEAVRRRVLDALGDEPDGGPAASAPDRLLVLDDCDHVLYTCGTLLTELLPGRPRLSVLATSREPLHLPGESVFSVTGLALSDPESVNSLSDSLRSDAVSLFMDRARAVAPDFRLSRDNAADVAEICARLDGLPLPIEMAARLIRVFPPAEIRSRLHDRLALLTNGWRLADDRHQSLRAALEWGYALLKPVEQALLRRLSVLPGGFGPDAATAVTADVPGAATALPELLVALESKSVITPLTGAGGGAARFRMLESTLCFGQERLVAEGEDTATYERLTAWLTTISLPLRNEAVVPVAALDRLAEERVNLAHAVRRLGAGSDERQLLLAGALAAVEGAQGRDAEVAGLVEHALAQTAPDSEYRAVALEATALARRGTESDEAALRIDRAVREERRRGRTALLGRLLLERGILRQGRDEHRASLDDLDESLEIGLRSQHDTLVALSLGALARHWLESGDPAGAERELGRALPVLRCGVAPQWLSAVLSTAGSLALEKGDLKRAEEYFTQALRCRAHQHEDAARALEGLALVATRGYRFDRGVRLLGVAERVRGGRPGESDWWRQRVQQARETALRALPVGRAESWLEAGRAMPWRQALCLALGEESAEPRARGAAHPLSRRERDVAALVVEGLTNRQIAARIHVSVRTVETHIRHIRTTLGLRSRAHIAAWAAQQQADGPQTPAPAPAPFASASAAVALRRLPDPREVLRGVGIGGGAARPELRGA